MSAPLHWGAAVRVLLGIRSPSQELIAGERIGAMLTRAGEDGYERGSGLM